MTAQLDRGLAALRQEFAAEIASGLITHLGTTNCRRKNNTADGPWSEHSWPNAVDVMLKRIPGTATPTPEARAVGFRVAAWMRAHPELWSEIFWQVAAHFDHVHGTATPRMNYDNKQVPPCAGGPPEPTPIPEDIMFTKGYNEADWKRCWDAGLVAGADWASFRQYWVVDAADRTDAEHLQASGNIVLAIAGKLGSGGVTMTQVTAEAKKQAKAVVNASKNVAV